MINQEPVFIMGSPRSGTTILQALIDTQNQIEIFKTIYFFTGLVSIIKTDIDGNILNKFEIEKKLIEDMAIDNWDDSIIKNTLYKSNISLKELYESIIYYNLKDKNKRWLDKTPNYTYMIDMIHAFYPKAKFLFVLRNPLDAIYSRKLKLPWDQERPIELITQYWCNALSNYKNFKEKYPEKIMFIKYENFSQNYEQDMGKIMNFLNLKYDKMLLQNYQKSISHVTSESETWKKDMTKEIMKTDKYNISQKNYDIIINIAKKDMKEYGYL